MEYKEFKKIAGYHHLTVSESLYDGLETYADYLIEYNEKVNLTAITERRDVYIKHFLDSLIPLTYIDISKGATLIDVGTGAGFPSIPIKLYRPDIKLTLLDSLQKRITFLENLCNKLEISVECVHGRAEDFGKNSVYREKFNYAIARAVANMHTLCEYCIPFVRIGGSFIAMKGLSENLDESSKAIKILGGRICNDITYTIPPEDNRRIIVINKVSSTPLRYPRAYAKIKAKPL